MDWQAAFNILWSVIMAGTGFMINAIVQDIRSIKGDIAGLPDVYARRDDVKEGFQHINATLERIIDKLDRKVDKSGG